VLRSRKSALRTVAVALGLTLALAACGGDDKKTTDATSGASALSGTINGDGSSTVFPILEGVVEDMRADNPDLKINVGESGTGGGFEKFCAGQTDFSNASRAIKDAEIKACEAKGVKYTEFKIASDGLSVVSHPDLKIDCLSFDELKKTFAAGSTVKKAADIKAGLPADNIKLFTPGADSGTYDFFLEEVLGKEGKFRADGVTTSEDDNVLVQGINGTKGGVGFFGYAYFEQNKDKLNLVAVKDDAECVTPSVDTVRDGSYPLSRPLFVYVKNDALARPEVKGMMSFILGDGGRAIIEEVGYVELEDAAYQEGIAKLGS
jgi:phosphate transport system substrate-binding protein